LSADGDIAVVVWIWRRSGRSLGVHRSNDHWAHGIALDSAGRIRRRPRQQTYSHVVEVNGPHRTVYLAGQTGVDATGKVAEGFRAQAVQVMENIKTALASVGGGFEHIVKLTSYLTNLEANAPEFREIRGSYFPNKQALPASTLLQVPRLANPAFLLEVEAIAVLLPKA
jgi:enamine deaminase RidA (YjgF/YER057c/UK114 family)